MPSGLRATGRSTTKRRVREGNIRSGEIFRIGGQKFCRIQETGAILHVISDTTPWNNRQKEDREERFPFAILSDLDGSTHRGWNAYDTRNQEILEAVCVVDRKGFITRTVLGPDHLGTTDEWVAALK